MKHPIILAVCLMLLANFTYAQNKYEREYRIKKSEFPQNSLEFISSKLENIRRVKFYKELDSVKISYEAKFKKDKLWYSVEFDQNGELEDIEILIKEIDIPEESLVQIKNYFSQNFEKYRIRKIQQQYPVSENEDMDTTIKNAFQNLILPSINYEIIVACREEKGYQDYEALFDAEGKFLKIRKSLPANYDHVLY